MAAIAVVVVVLAVGAGIGTLVSENNDNAEDTSGPVVAPRGATGGDDLVIPAGPARAPATLAVYEDFRCPACMQFEDTFRDTVHQLQDSRRMRTQYHLVTLIDSNQGGSGSLAAANAAACAQDAGKFTAYHDVLYRNQPAETDDSFADDDRLISLADKVSGLNTAAFRRCVRDGTHNGWVHESDQAFNKAGFGATPTVLLNGKSVFGARNKPLTPADLKQRVAAVAGD